MGLLLISPNFSEGRRPEVVEALAGALDSAPGVRLLALASDPQHNRTVITAAGPPEAVAAGVLRSAEAALRLIDLNAHRGHYPRIGALDVLPLSPLAGMTLEQAAAAAREIGAVLAGQLGLPVYFYGHGATRTLDQVREGEFEGLAARMSQPDGAPDAGPAEPHPTGGALAVGARLLPLQLRLTLGRAGSGESAGAGEAARRARALPGVREAVPLADDALQVTLADWQATPLAALAREVCSRQVRVDGLIPLAPVLAAARAGLPLEVEPDQVPEWLYWDGP